MHPGELHLIRTSRNAPFLWRGTHYKEMEGVHQGGSTLWQGPGGLTRRLRFRGVGWEWPGMKGRKLDLGLQTASSSMNSLKRWSIMSTHLSASDSPGKLIRDAEPWAPPQKRWVLEQSLEPVFWQASLITSCTLKPDASFLGCACTTTRHILQWAGEVVRGDCRATSVHPLTQPTGGREDS